MTFLYKEYIIIDNGYTYNTLIADSVNTVAKNLYKKLGYNLHFTNHKKDFYFVEL
jgi:predicted GNAT family acetyltransferase